MGFIDGTGVPLQRYKDFRVANTSGKAIAEGIQKAYPEILQRDVNAHKSGENEIKEFVKGITELPEGNKIIHLTARTFIELAKMAKFEDVEYPITVGFHHDTNITKLFNTRNQTIVDCYHHLVSYPLQIDIPLFLQAGEHTKREGAFSAFPGSVGIVKYDEYPGKKTIMLSYSQATFKQGKPEKLTRGFATKYGG